MILRFLRKLLRRKPKGPFLQQYISACKASGCKPDTDLFMEGQREIKKLVKNKPNERTSLIVYIGDMIQIVQIESGMIISSFGPKSIAPILREAYEKHS